MTIKIDRPTENEWVVAVPEEQAHYYVVSLPARIGKLDARQVVIAKLGEYHTRYLFDFEVYSTKFFSTDKLPLIMDILSMFVQCRDKDNPIELVYEFGGDLFHPVRKTHPREGVLQ